MHKITESNISTAWAADVKVPIPGEEHRAGGGIGTPITIEGADANGGLTYSAASAAVRVRQLGGVSQTLAVTVTVNDIDVQLGTDGAGVVTSTANAVFAAIAAVPAAVALIGTLAVTGTGAGLAAVSPNSDWVQLSDGEAGSIRQMIDALTARTRFLVERAGTWGAPWRFYSSNGTDLNIIGLGLAGPGIFVDTGTPTVYTPAGLANNTWYYLYASVSVGALAYVKSTNQPDIYFKGETGVSNRRYVGCFRTDGAAAIIPFYANHGNYLWDEAQPMYAGITDTSWTAKLLTSRVPPHHAGPITIQMVLNDTSTSTNFALVRMTGSSGAGIKILETQGSKENTGTVEVTCSAGQSIDYMLSGAGTAAIRVLGWRDR